MTTANLAQRLWQKLSPQRIMAHDFHTPCLSVSGAPTAVEAVEEELTALAQLEQDARRTPDDFRVGSPYVVNVDGRRSGKFYVEDGTKIWPFSPAASRAHREWLVALSAKHVGAAINYHQGLDQCTQLVAENGQLRQEVDGKLDFVFARSPRGQLCHPSATVAKQNGGPLVRISQSRHGSGVKCELVQE